MRMYVTIRMLAAVCAAALCGRASFAMPPEQNHPAPVQRIPPSRPIGNPTANAGRMAGQARGAHLGQWMQQHGSLTPQQQQQALHNEPGFNQLPPQTQQRMADRLNQLNSLPEPRRDRVISRNEAMERLTPDQRGNVRGAMGQLGALPQDRRRLVAKSFRDLRDLPTVQRNAILNSPQYRQQFSDEERGTLGNLLSVGPLLPPSR